MNVKGPWKWEMDSVQRKGVVSVLAYFYALFSLLLKMKSTPNDSCVSKRESKSIQIKHNGRYSKEKSFLIRNETEFDAVDTICK